MPMLLKGVFIQYELTTETSTRVVLLSVAPADRTLLNNCVKHKLHIYIPFTGGSYNFRSPGTDLFPGKHLVN